MQLLMNVAAFGLELVHRKGDHDAIKCWTRFTVAATGLRTATKLLLFGVDLCCLVMWRNCQHGEAGRYCLSSRC
ncbi:hypothetical protein NC652_034078 [Populus alba x Populus x berolinensis]|nr:hypothetical protein NC652_034078 [Populus alba x Populus x berolinensis]KAJ6973820.1 hypothetical protein NC653_033982 [Populus alba x Populus x berolinensis]